MLIEIWLHYGVHCSPMFLLLMMFGDGFSLRPPHSISHHVRSVSLSVPCCNSEFCVEAHLCSFAAHLIRIFIYSHSRTLFNLQPILYRGTIQSSILNYQKSDQPNPGCIVPITSRVGPSFFHFWDGLYETKWSFDMKSGILMSVIWLSTGEPLNGQVVADFFPLERVLL